MEYAGETMKHVPFPKPMNLQWASQLGVSSHDPRQICWLLTACENRTIIMVATARITFTKIIETSERGILVYDRQLIVALCILCVVFSFF